MGETCEVCGREKWEYSGPARKPTNCMEDYDWCPDDNAAQHWRRGYERSQAALAAARTEIIRLRAFLDANHIVTGAYLAAPAACVTPNGRTDGHGSYVERQPDGSWICTFCKRPVDGADPAAGEERKR